MKPSLVEILREAVDTSPAGIEPWAAATRIVGWLPSLELPADAITVDIARALAGVALDLDRTEKVDRELLDAVCKAREPYIDPLAGGAAVFRPGGQAGGNVFTDWDQLQQAIAHSRGASKPSSVTIEFDDSVGPVNIPDGGIYDMSGVVWSGKPNGPPVTVNIQPGVQLKNLRSFAGNVNVNNVGPRPALTFPQPTAKPKPAPWSPRQRRRRRIP